MSHENLEQNILKSIRGKKKIIYRNYLFNYIDIYREKISWRCNKRGCPSYLYTTCNYTFCEMTDHNHCPDMRKAERAKLMTIIKERAMSSNETPRQLIVDILSNELTYQPLPYKYVRDKIVKHRKANSFTYSFESDIPNEIQKTYMGEDFLLHDSGIADEERIIVFGTNSNLIHLMHNNVWVVDGTFKSAPSNFEQLYTIQCKIRGKFLPLISALMKKKTTTSYIKLFEFIKSRMQSFYPMNIILDFEHASFNALKITFPESILSGCLFHLSQIVWRRVQSQGFCSLYKESYNFKLDLKMILALSFVPTMNVLNEAKKLRSYFLNERKCSQSISILEWFYKQYITSVEYSTNSNKNISFWNVYSRTISGIPRTSNSLEGYHRHLNCLIMQKQHSILLIGKELIKEQSLIENFLISSLYNSKEIIQPDESNLTIILQNYDTYYHMDFLKAIALAFAFPLNN